MRSLLILEARYLVSRAEPMVAVRLNQNIVANMIVGHLYYPPYFNDMGKLVNFRINLQ